MEEEGYFIGIALSLTANLGTIFEVTGSPGRWIRNIDGNIINVLWFGALGNPAVDSTNALKDAVKVVNAYSVTSPDPGTSYYGNKPTLYFPRGDRYTCSATLNIGAGVNVEMEAPVSFVDPTDSLPGMVIGSDGASNASVKLSIRIVKETISGWTNESCIGVKLINLLSSRLNLEFVSSFTINAQLMGSVQCAYNRAGIGTLKDGKIQLDLQASGTEGFCNENVFTGGRFAVNSLSGLANKARYGVRIGMSGTTAHIPNNNVFYKPSFELSASTGWLTIRTIIMTLSITAIAGNHFSCPCISTGITLPVTFSEDCTAPIKPAALCYHQGSLQG
ncbi:hypothetical protein QFZ51_002619 [Chitinophaga sp. W3I9]|uniref:hypothetical protein n=1 Tax=Chitinophaga sp. W3I9 TaxID=3373924 RepID=UPI003D1956B0